MYRRSADAHEIRKAAQTEVTNVNPALTPWLSNMKQKSFSQKVRRARDPEGSKMDFGSELRDFLSMHFVKSPASDMDLP